MLKHAYVHCAFFILAFSGCAASSGLNESGRIRDVQIHGQGQITPIELHASVGEEIRWHNLLSTPVHLGFLGVKPINNEVGCEKGFKTWYGGVKDLVTIHPGEYVSVCFIRARTVRYNIWTDLSKLFHSMSMTAVIYLDGAT
jgi:hypothetical protein